MDILHLSLPDLPRPDQHPKVIHDRKKGHRLEYKVDESKLDSFRQLGRKILALAKKPDQSLIYVSYLCAKKGDQDQDFHQDSQNSSLRVLIYLTDVMTPQDGAIEFDNGPVVGPRGTAVFYDATQKHRGLANRSDRDRWALGLVFSNKSQNVQTFGVYLDIGQVSTVNYVAGVVANFYHITEDVLPERDVNTWLSPAATTSYATTLNNDLLPIDPSNLAMKASGFIYSSESTTIRIKAITDDGSAVDINGTNVVMDPVSGSSSSWGPNGNVTYTTSSVVLNPGMNPITFWWYNADGGANLNFSYQLGGTGDYQTDWSTILYSPVLHQPMIWLSEWSDQIVYYRNNIVTFNGNTYVCRGSGVSNNPDDEPDSWVIMGSTNNSSSSTVFQDIIMFIFIIMSVVILVGLIYFCYYTPSLTTTFTRIKS